MLYRDTVPVEPGSRPFFGPGSVSKDTFTGVVGGKDTFSYTNHTSHVLTNLETGSLSVSNDTFMSIEHIIGKHEVIYMNTAVQINAVKSCVN